MCHIPNQTMVDTFAKARMMAGVTLDIGPLAKLEAAAKMAEEAEMDMSDLLGMEQSVSSIPPSFDAKLSGQLVQLSNVVRMTGGTFNLFDPIKLKEQLTLMEGELNRRASRIQAMAGLNLGAMVRLGAVARVVARLKLQGLDPEDPGFMDGVAARARTYAHVNAHRPQIALKNLPRIHLVASIPKLLEAANEAEIDIGDPPTHPGRALMLRLKPIMGIAVPDIQVKIKAILAAAAVIDNVAKIEETFGELGSNRFRPIAYRLEAALAVGARLNLPKMAMEVPLPLPEEVRAGEEALRSPLFRNSFQGFVMPTLNILPPIQAYLALRAVLSSKLKIPPTEACLMCGST